jgi:hypothetical protein
MSVQFVENGGSSSSSKPTIDFAAFASKANEIDLGDDVVELGDDLGLGMLANQSKVAPSPKMSSSPASRQINFSSGGESRSEMPQLQIKPIDDLDVVNLDAAPGVGDIGISRAPDTTPFVIDNGAGSGGLMMESRSSGGNTLSGDQEHQAKKKALRELKRLENEGFRVQRLTMQNSLEEMKDEIDSHKDVQNLEASLRFQRNLMMTFVTGVEILNEKVKHRLPVKPRLKGWSESVHTNISDFDPMFEEMYDLMKDKEKVHPMLRIAGTLGMSAVMYHLTTAEAEKSGIPGIDSLMQEDPEFRQMYAAKMAAKMGGGLGNFMTTAGMGGTMGGITSTGGAPFDPMAMGMGVPPPSPPPQQSARVPFNMAAASATLDPGTGPQKARREMRGPANMDDIIKAFETERMVEAARGNPIQGVNANIFTPSGPPPTPPRGVSILREGVGTGGDPLSDFLNGDDGGSVMSGSTMNTERRRGRPRRTAVTPAGATLTLNV